MGTGGAASCVRRSRSDFVAFFDDGLSQGLAWLWRLDFNAAAGSVDLDVGSRIYLVDGAGDRFFTMATGHASDLEGLVHEVIPGKMRMG